MIQKITLLFLLFFTSSVSLLYGQTTYAITNEKKIYQIHDDYSATYICTVSPTQYLINDIAVSPSGAVYAIAYNTLYQVDLTTGATTWIVDLPPNFYVSLVCDNDYELYMINSLQKTLYKYNVQTHVLTQVAYLGYETSGDLAFYKGHLIFQTNDNSGVYMIKAFNTVTHTLIDVMCQPFYFQLWGLANYGGCNGEMMLAVNPANEFLEIDLDAQTYTSHAFSLPNNQKIYGLARTDEYLGALCTAQQLTDLNCTLSLSDYSQNNFTVYPNPAGNTINVRSQSEITAITIYDTTGKLVMTVQGNQLKTADVSRLAKGFYILQVKSGDSVATKKFLKN